MYFEQVTKIFRHSFFMMLKKNIQPGKS